MRKSPRKIESFLGETYNYLTLIELIDTTNYGKVSLKDLKIKKNEK